MASISLTARETAIVVLMAGGHTTPDIAALLDLHHRTVENHKRHIYEKLGVGTQNGAVAEATSRGLLNGTGHRRWPGEPGRPMLVLLSGPDGTGRDSVAHALVADGIPFVSLNNRDALITDHWARWHRGVVIAVLIDPEPETGRGRRRWEQPSSWCGPPTPVSDWPSSTRWLTGRTA
jgi:DNA-binding CsgD family transcriptional regulator